MARRRTFFNQIERRLRCILAIILFIIVFSNQYSAAVEPLNVYVVNYPLMYFAERIGGNQVQVEFPVPGDVDPAYWNPDIVDIAAFQKADLILLNGAGYAKWVRKVSLPRSKIIDTSAKVKKQYIYSKNVVTHSHGGKGKHAHEALAFTTWLNFEMAAGQAEAIANALARKRPEMKDNFRANMDSLAADLRNLDQDIQTITSKSKSTPMIVSHPVYEYFTRRYGLNIVSVHWEPDEVPKQQQLANLKEILNEHPAKWMIWEAEPDSKSVEKLKAIGVESLVFNPCGNLPEQGDFMSVMRRNAENLRNAFK